MHNPRPFIGTKGAYHLAALILLAFISAQVQAQGSGWGITSGSICCTASEIRIVYSFYQPSYHWSTLDTPYLTSFARATWQHHFASGTTSSVWGGVSLYANGAERELRTVIIDTGRSYHLAALPEGDFRHSFWDITTSQLITYDSSTGQMGHLAWSQDDFNPNAAAIFTPLHSSILPGSLESLYGDFLYQQQQGRYVLTGMHGLCNIAASSGGLDYRFVTFNSQGDLLNVDSAIIPGQRLTLDIGPIRDLDTGTRYQRNTHTNAYEALNVDPGLIGIVGDLYVPSPNTSILIFGGLFCIRRHRKT